MGERAVGDAVRRARQCQYSSPAWRERAICLIYFIEDARRRRATAGRFPWPRCPAAGPPPAGQVSRIRGQARGAGRVRPLGLSGVGRPEFELPPIPIRVEAEKPADAGDDLAVERQMQDIGELVVSVEPEFPRSSRQIRGISRIPLFALDYLARRGYAWPRPSCGPSARARPWRRVSSPRPAPWRRRLYPALRGSGARWRGSPASSWSGGSRATADRTSARYRARSVASTVSGRAIIAAVRAKVPHPQILDQIHAGLGQQVELRQQPVGHRITRTARRVIRRRIEAGSVRLKWGVSFGQAASNIRIQGTCRASFFDCTGRSGE